MSNLQAYYVVENQTAGLPYLDTHADTSIMGALQLASLDAGMIFSLYRVLATDPAQAKLFYMDGRCIFKNAVYLDNACRGCGGAPAVYTNGMCESCNVADETAPDLK